MKLPPLVRCSQNSWTRIATAVLLAVGFAFVAAEIRGHAQTPPPPVSLPFSLSYLTTGNYVTGAVDLPGAGSSSTGFATGIIHMSTTATADTRVIPANTDGSPADILGAWLYWETIVSDPSQLAGVQFRGINIDLTNAEITRQAPPLTLTGPYASCWAANASGTTYTMYQMRADVRRLLPLQYDANGNSTGKRLVNDVDLPIDPSTGQPQYHTVTLPDAANGNHAPVSAGASLVVVYRDPRQLLRKIVIYDGIGVLPNLDGAALQQTLQGIYQSATDTQAMLTVFGASGQPNGTDQWFLTSAPNGQSTTTLLASNPFPGTSNASDRSWSNVAVNLSSFSGSSLMPGFLRNDGYGETLQTTVSHTKTSPYDCLSWGGIVLSTAVKDVDSDGAPDAIEDGVATIGSTTVPVTTDADGTALPNLPAMGGSSHHQDIYFQMDAMANTAQRYGDPTNAPFPGVPAGYVDIPAHSHLPSPGAVKLMIDTYLHAPVTNTFTGGDGTLGVWPHFDVGDPSSYISALGSAYAQYFVPSQYAKGGQIVAETRCGLNSDTSNDCPYYYYPGTVGWLHGFEQYENGTSSSPPLVPMDSARDGIFHHAFYVHARGVPRSPFPCLDSSGTPTNYDSTGTCGAPLTNNPQFHVPMSISGVAQLPGERLMISVGLWDQANGVGSDALIAGTTLHEAGHNGELWHGGAPPVWNGQTLYFEPNCKPNYTSIMSYLFQVVGERDDQGKVYFDYSRDANFQLHSLDETTLTTNFTFSPLLQPYRTAWFAPVVPGTLPYLLGSSPAKRYCNGMPFPNPLPAGWVNMARVDGPTTTSPIDWDADGEPTGTMQPSQQDLNFDGVLSSGVPPSVPLHGFDDWANLRLNQTGGGKNANGFSSGTKGINGTGDDGTKGINGTDDSGTKGINGVTGNSGTMGDTASINSSGTKGINGTDSGQDIDIDRFAASGFAPPNKLTACVIGTTGCASASASAPLHRVALSWLPPNAGTVSSYTVLRSTGSTFSLVGLKTYSAVTTTTFVDPEELPNAQQFTYVVKATFTEDNGGTGPASNSATVVAVNDAPLPSSDSYTTKVNTTLTVSAPGVLANDNTDDDSPNFSTERRAVPRSQVPTQFNGTVTINADGSFTYTPAKNFIGADTFTYQANDGVWVPPAGTNPGPSYPMSPDSAAVTVTITVTKK